LQAAVFLNSNRELLNCTSWKAISLSGHFPTSMVRLTRKFDDARYLHPDMKGAGMDSPALPTFGTAESRAYQKGLCGGASLAAP
jgi:hypothetical protein